MKKRVIALLCALVISAVAVMGVGAYIKYVVLLPLGLGQEHSIVELPFLMLTDEGLRYSVEDALRGTDESTGTTEQTTEPATEATTEVTTEATTEPTAEATTEAVTEPSTEPTTEPTTEPATEPTTQPPTEPSIGETDPTHTHSYSDTVVAPTCTEKGYTLHKCQCGASYRDTETAASGHNYSSKTVEPTCTEKGYVKYTCKVCGAWYSDSETPAKGHSYTSKVVEPTTSSQGYTEYTCTVCGSSYRDNYTEQLPTDGTEETTEPTEPTETTPVVAPVYSDKYPGYDFSNGVADSWYDNVLFIGDSRTVGLRDYARSGNAEYFCSVGMSVFNFDERTCSDVGFSSQTLESLLSSRSYDKIFISLGINECGYSTSSLINAYKDLVDMVRKYQPNAKIILQGIMTVTEKYASGKSYFQPDHINSINDRIYGIAASGSNIYYIDVNEYFTNRNGYLYSDITGDGCHLYANYYGVWADWISYAVARLGL